MLNIKTALRDGAGTMVEHSGQFLLYSVAWAIVVGSAIFLGGMYGLSFVAIFLVYLPVQTSLAMIAKNAVDQRDLSNNDFYFGFKMMMPSLVLQSKMVMRGFLLSFLTFMATLFLSSLIVGFLIQRLEPSLFQSLMQSTDLLAIYDSLNNLPWFSLSLLISIILSLLVAAITYLLTGCPTNFAPFISFETPFNQDAAVTLSKRIVHPVKKTFFYFNLIFLLFLIPVAVLGGAMYYLLINFTVWNELLIGFLTTLLIAFCLAPINLLHQVSSYHFYRQRFQAEIKVIYQDFLKRSQEQQAMASQATSEDVKEEPSEKDDELK